MVMVAPIVEHRCWTPATVLLLISSHGNEFAPHPPFRPPALSNRVGMSSRRRHGLERLWPDRPTAPGVHRVAAVYEPSRAASVRARPGERSDQAHRSEE